MNGQIDNSDLQWFYRSLRNIEIIKSLKTNANIDVTIYHETILLARINNFQESIFNTDKHWSYFNDFL